jgi:hypothetical protein
MKKAISFKYINYILHALIWGTVLFFPYFVSSAQSGYKIGSVPGVFFTLLGLIHMVIFYTNALFLYPKLLNKRFWWLYILSVIVLIFGSFQVKYQITVTWFPQILKNEEVYRFIFPPSIGALVISIVYCWVINKIRFEKEQKEKQAQQLITELKFLRSQISPHFLFNVLTNLVSLARKKSEKLEPSLILLSNLMRYMLYDTQGKKVALTKEIEYLTSYIELQKLRFENDVKIDNNIDINEAGSHATIEPMLLIPFVENAFKHGVGSFLNPFISIKLVVTSSTLLFEIQNKVEKDLDTSKDEDSGIGINNVMLRLNLLYKNKHSLKINDQNGIFHVSLTLNLE